VCDIILNEKNKFMEGDFRLIMDEPPRDNFNISVIESILLCFFGIVESLFERISNRKKIISKILSKSIIGAMRSIHSPFKINILLS